MVDAAEPLAVPRAGTSRRSGLWARISRSENALGLMLISPTFVYALVLLVAPISLIVLFSFWTQTYLTIDRTFTFANYVEVWTDPLYRSLMLRSLWVSGLVTVVTVVLAYPMAYFIAFHTGRNKMLWLFLITTPFWSSYLLRVFSWKVILGFDGVLNSALMSLGIIAEPLSFLLYNVNAVVVTLAHAWAPFAILPIFVSLQKIDRSLLEAATDLGDGKLRRFLRVTLPLSLPGIVGASVIIFIPTIGDYVTPRLVGGTDGLLIANIIQAQFGRAANFPLGAALAVCAMTIVCGVALLVVTLLRVLGSRIR